MALQVPLSASPRRRVLAAALVVSFGSMVPRQTAAQVHDLHVEGYVQGDARLYPGSSDAVSSFLVRRARVSVDGTVGHLLVFQLTPDIGMGAATLAEGTVGARLGDGLLIKVGLTKPRIGLEATQRSADLHLIERGLPAYLLPSRDLGVTAGGSLLHGALSYDVGLFNGVPDYGTSTRDAGNGKDLSGRVFVTPFASRGEATPIQVGVGIGASTGIENGSLDQPLTSTIRSPGQVTFFEYRAGNALETVIAEGRRERIDPQAYLYAGPFGLLAEWVESRHHVRRGGAEATIGHRAWQLSGTVLLTGEKAGFGPLVPRHELWPEKGQWGAVELAARLEGAEVDEAAFPLLADGTVSARWARGVAVGMSWYFARRTKLVVEYERTTFKGGALAGDRAAEHFLGARLQVSR